MIRLVSAAAAAAVSYPTGLWGLRVVGMMGCSVGRGGGAGV